MSINTLIIRPLIITLSILLIPFFGNIYVDGWDWNWMVFIIFGLILFSIGFFYEFAGKKAKQGFFSGLIFGGIVASLLLITIRYINPVDDIAGIVIITFLIFGILFGLIGYRIEKYFKKRK